MSDWQLSLTFVLIFIGAYAAGWGAAMRKVTDWRIRWIELEHDSAKREGRKPRDINETFPDS